MLATKTNYGKTSARSVGSSPPTSARLDAASALTPPYPYYPYYRLPDFTRLNPPAVAAGSAQ